MKHGHKDSPEDLIYRAMLKELDSSQYRDSTRELRKAWAIGWLIRLLAQEYSGSWQLKQRIKTILGLR